MNSLIFSYIFDKKGGYKKALEQSNGFSWLHLDSISESCESDLKNLGLKKVIINSLLAEETRPRMSEVDNGIILNLRGVNLNSDSTPEDMVSIRIWIEKDRIISVRKRKLRAIEDLQNSFEIAAPKSPIELVSMLISKLFARIEPVLAELDDNVDLIEEEILESADNNLRLRIVDIRKKALLFRRYMSPQREAISKLISSNFVNSEIKINLQESYNHILRYLEDLDTIRERSQIVKDELVNILSDRLNKNMYLISIITTIFLPLGFLTGLLGVNLSGIPGSNNEISFNIFCCVLLLLVIFEIFLFRKFKWF